MPGFANYPAEYRSNVLGRRAAKTMRHISGLNWSHVETIRRQWKGNLILKGILRADDAVKAYEYGIDGIVVSSHRARNLDSAVAPIEVLQSIADAVGERMTVLADSGIQRGSDIFKLLACGAKAVMIGKGLLYGTAVGGEAGAAQVIEMFRQELDITMALAGHASLHTIKPSAITA